MRPSEVPLEIDRLTAMLESTVLLVEKLAKRIEQNERRIAVLEMKPGRAG